MNRKTTIDIYDYDAELEDFLKRGKSVLKEAYDINIFKKLNSISVLEFKHFKDLNMDRDYEAYNKTQFIQVEAICKVLDDYYVIRQLTEEKGTNGVPTYSIYAEHIISELLDKMIVSINMASPTCQQVVNTVLTDTRFTCDASAIPGNRNFKIEREQVMHGLQEACKVFDADITFDIGNPFHIILVPNQLDNQEPAMNMIRFQYNKNMTSIKRTVDTSNVVNRVWCFGELFAPFAVNHYNEYSPYYYRNPKEGKMEFEEEVSKASATNFALAYLSRVYLPKTTYEMDIIELKHHPDFILEEFDVGQRVHVYDTDLGIDYITKVVEYDQNPDKPDASKIVLTNYVERITSHIADLDDKIRNL